MNLEIQSTTSENPYDVNSQRTFFILDFNNTIISQENNDQKAPKINQDLKSLCIHMNIAGV